MCEDPTSGHWFAFINRRATQIKVLVFEAGGYCVWSKRLEQGRFAALSAAGSVKRGVPNGVSGAARRGG